MRNQFTFLYQMPDGEPWHIQADYDPSNVGTLKLGVLYPNADGNTVLPLDMWAMVIPSRMLASGRIWQRGYQIAWAKVLNLKGDE